MFVYFDNSATTKTFDEVNLRMLDMLQNDFGNPSSLHKLGLNAEEKIKYTRNLVAKSIECDANDVYFTSGGTEANNLCITGYLLRNRHAGKKVITDSVEHASVAKQFDYLRELGYDVKIIGFDKEKGFLYDELEKEIDENTALVSIMHVNNETGYIFDIKRIKEIIGRKNKNTVLHCDCVQSYMKIPVKVKELGADLISISAHKINGPKGVGAAYIRKGIFVSPNIIGGGQEKGLRNGTENTAGIYGFGAAIEEHLRSYNDNIKKYEEIKEYMYKGFMKMGNVSINTDMKNSAPHILNVSFLNIRSEILLHTLEQFEIYVSSGSACSSNDKKKKKVLEVMGYDRSVYDSAIRFSFGTFNNINEAEYALGIIEKEVAALRKRLRIQ